MDGYLRISTKIDTKSFDSQISYIEAQLEEIAYKLEQADKGVDVGDTMKLEAKYEKLSNQLTEMILKKEKLNDKDIEAEINSTNIKTATDSISDSVGNVIKKCIRWAAAVFGVRGAYNAIRNAMGIISQYDKQLAIDVEYIKYALAMVLKPIIEWIVKAVYKILSYVNMLSKTLFGINLFKNSGVDSFSEALDNSAKSAKNIKNSLTGFDEMNILDDTNDSTENVMPSVDLSTAQIEDIPVPEWLKWIKDNWQTIVGAIGAIIISYVAFKTALGIASGGKGDNQSNPFGGFLDGLGKATMAIAILGGIGIVINQIIELIKAFSESGLSLKEVAGLLGVVLGGLAIAFTTLALASKLMDWTSIAGAAVILGGLALVINEVTDLIDTFADSGLKLNEVIGLMATIFVTIVALMGSIALLGPLMTAGLGPFLVVVAGISAILTVMALTLPKILDACSEFITKSAPGISQILLVIGEQIQGIIEQLGVVLPPIIDSVGNLFSKIFNGTSKVINSVGSVIIKILETTERLISNTLSSLLNFINRLGPAINNFVNNAISATTKLINFLISGVEYLINTLIVNGVNKIITAVNSLSQYVGINIPTVSQQYIPRFTPKLAVGGIVNLPGRGVPVGGALAGEAGREGVLPLDNTATMEEIGRAIGRHVVINLTSNTNLDGRRIARDVKRITNETAFATNS